MGRLCKSEGCTRPVNASRSKKTGRLSTPSYCGSCRAKREKAHDLVAWAYRKLKSNAKRRRIFFDLTEPQFREFCYETQILIGRGRTATSYHVDRIDEELGYTVGNLQKLTNSENAKKEVQRQKRKIYDYELAERRRLSAFESEEEELETARLSLFRFVDDTEEPTQSIPPF
jgi:hypothetical protein